MVRPDAAVVREVRRDGRVPVLGVDDGGPCLERRGDQRIDGRHDLLATRHVQAARRIGEVVLDIDHDERGPRVEVGCMHCHPRVAPMPASVRGAATPGVPAAAARGHPDRVARTAP